MERVSTFIRTVYEWHAPTYYDDISDYEFLYVKNGVYFTVKYHYYNGLASFRTSIVPDWCIDKSDLNEKTDEHLHSKEVKILDNCKSFLDNLPTPKTNERLYGEEVKILDNYKSILDSLPSEVRKEIEDNMKPLHNKWQEQRVDENIRLLLLAYEMSGRSLI